MRKLKNIIEKAYDFGKLQKGITPYMMARLVDIYNALARKEEAEFIESEINALLAGCGIKTRQRGIGWVAYR